MTAAELLIEELRKQGITWIATLCGHGLDPLLQAAVKLGMRLVDTRNEQTAADIAESSASFSVSGRRGASIATALRYQH